MAIRIDCEAHDSKCGGCGWKTYQCSRCGGCYQCEHTVSFSFEEKRWTWTCKDGKKRRIICEPCVCQKKEAEKRRLALLTSFVSSINLSTADHWPI